MLQNYNKYKVLKIFLDQPLESFRLRELSRLCGISPLSISNYLKEFEKEELLERYVKDKIPFYRALRDNLKFIRYKRISSIYELYESGIIDYLWDEINPEAIVLYGSVAKGESIMESDIDLFLVANEREVELDKYEKILGKEIHLLFSSDFKGISNELKNNIINGVVMKGYLKII